VGVVFRRARARAVTISICGFRHLKKLGLSFRHIPQRRSIRKRKIFGW
jgi:hypothetical protein